MIAINRLTAAALLAAGLTAPVLAQQSGSGNVKALPPHVTGHLWPERELLPMEQEFKDRVIAVRDTVMRVRATASLLERQQRSGAGAGVIRSSARTLAADCARLGRSAESMAGFAADFATNDPKWGDQAVRTFRSAVAELAAEMRRCRDSMASEAAAATPDRDRVSQAAAGAVTVAAKYERAELDLVNTLKIRIDPRGSGTQPGR